MSNIEKVLVYFLILSIRKGNQNASRIYLNFKTDKCIVTAIIQQKRRMTICTNMSMSFMTIINLIFWAAGAELTFLGSWLFTNMLALANLYINELCIVKKN